MKGKSSTEKVEVEEEKKHQQIGRKEGRTCNRCKFYDSETERDFRRKVGPKDESGQRAEIVEVRAVCRNPKANAFNHLVHATQLKRKCEFWKEGVYKKPEKETKKETTK